MIAVKSRTQLRAIVGRFGQPRGRPHLERQHRRCSSGSGKLGAIPTRSRHCERSDTRSGAPPCGARSLPRRRVARAGAVTAHQARHTGEGAGRRGRGRSRPIVGVIALRESGNLPQGVVSTGSRRSPLPRTSRGCGGPGSAARGNAAQEASCSQGPAPALLRSFSRRSSPSSRLLLPGPPPRKRLVI